MNVHGAVPQTQEGPRTPVGLRFLMFVVVLWVFFLAINMMGSSLKALTAGHVDDILRRTTENPVIGLLLGILATSIIQSSSTTTSIVVGMAAVGTVSLAGAIPMIMGANIGTTVTNTLVSFAHVNQKAEFKRALAASTVHDFFNIIVTVILFPLEVLFHPLQKAAEALQEAIVGTGSIEVAGLKTLIKPIVKGMMEFLHTPWLSLILSLVVLFFSLAMMVRLMKSIFINRMARAVDRFLFRNAASAMVVGVIFTVLVQSSSVTTSLVVPLVGAGILTLEQIFPFTLGANIGTTVTAFLAALAISSTGVSDKTAAVGLTVAIVHLLFNIAGIVLVYPIRALPIWLSRWLAEVMTVSQGRVVWFILLYFALHLFPLLMFLFI